jgi:hypothetical protein
MRSKFSAANRSKVTASRALQAWRVAISPSLFTKLVIRATSSGGRSSSLDGSSLVELVEESILSGISPMTPSAIGAVAAMSGANFDSGVVVVLMNILVDQAHKFLWKKRGRNEEEMQKQSVYNL